MGGRGRGVGVLEYWSIGVLECRSVGEMEKDVASEAHHSITPLTPLPLTRAMEYWSAGATITARLHHSTPPAATATPSPWTHPSSRHWACLCPRSASGIRAPRAGRRRAADARHRRGS